VGLTPGHRPGVSRLREVTGTHKAYGLYVHITWHTWRRQPSVHRADVLHVVDAMREAAQRCGVHIQEQAVLTDHVHIVASLRPDVTLASFVRHAKSESARRLNLNGNGGFRWARGYFAESLSRNHIATACVYVAKQHRRHPDLVPT